MSTEITIQDALNFLDPADDTNWTADGLPRMDVIEQLLDDTKITRQDVTDARPGFCRENAQKEPEVVEEAEVVEADPPTKAELEEMVNELDIEIGHIQAEKAKCLLALKRIHQAETKDHGHMHDMKGRLAYIAKQNELRAAKVKRFQEVSVMLNGNVNPKSAIDQAMSRRNTRGTARPARPPREE